MPLCLAIIGAGLAGLSAAIATKIASPQTDVLVLETVSSLDAVGAGLQITPNSTRLFQIWGIYEQVSRIATAARTCTINRYNGSKILSYAPKFQSTLLRLYGAPSWTVHRADLQQAMIVRAKELGVRLRLSSEVVDVDFDTPSVTVRGGDIVGCDIVLCADGLWSPTRTKFLGHARPPLASGQIGYRMLCRRDKIKDPELRQWVDKKMLNFWYGPGKHVVSYNLRGTELFSMSLVVSGDLPADVKFQQVDVEEVKAVFQGWDPILHRFFDEADVVTKWALYWLDPLPEWKTSNGKFLMVGDCCHPMPPYLAQGANSSLEDGAVFGHLFGKVAGPSHLPAMSSLYQEVRKRRGETLVRESFSQGDMVHLLDGPEQEERDAEYAKENMQIPWPQPRMQSWLYGYNAYDQAEEAYSQNPF